MLATVRAFPPLIVAMIGAGVAWMSLMSSFNVSVQTIVPAWVRARVLAIYMLVFFGSMALGSAVWGVIATHIGISSALLCAAGAMVVGLGGAYFFPLHAAQGLDLEPSLHWPDPLFVTEPHPKAGPILVTVDYQIEPESAADFVKAMREVQRILKRDGALRWGLLPTRPSLAITWSFSGRVMAEHAQHARVTGEDRLAQECHHFILALRHRLSPISLLRIFRNAQTGRA